MCIRDREQAYDRKHLPPIWMAESCIMELKLRATGEDDPKKQEWVQLPASRMKLELSLIHILETAPLCFDLHTRVGYGSDTAGNTGRLPCKGSDFRAIRYLLRLNLGIKKHDLVKSRVFIKLAALHPARCLRNSRNRSSISLSLLNLLRYGANRFRSKLSFFGGAAARCVAFDRASRHAA